MHIRNLKVTMVIMAFMAITLINIMLRSISMSPMIMKKKISLIVTIILLNGCAISPGMHLETKSSWFDESKYVSIDSVEEPIKLINISETVDTSYIENYSYLSLFLLIYD